MKLSLLFFVTASLVMQANVSYSQKTKISLDKQSATVKEVIDEIETSTEFKFFFNTKAVDLNRRVTVKVKKVSVNAILAIIFKGTDTSYEVDDRKILLTKSKEEKLSALTLPSAVNLLTKKIDGTITDSKGLPLPGANVLEKGTTNTVIADFDGKFSLTLKDENATIIVSFIGFDNQEIQTSGKKTFSIILKENISDLNEVVVVGYGIQKKSVTTGAISSIKASQLENMPVTRIEQSLQGRTSGVTVFQNAGQPGSASTVRVRGVTSFNGGANNPLYVVDGIIVDSGGIGTINQADIESMEVLKDAASSAIYGTRASSGVILITTKKGKAGKFTVSYNGFGGTSRAARKLDLLNSQQYASLRNEQYINGYSGSATPILPYPNVSSLGNGTNWQDVIFNDNAQRFQHELSLSGGNEKSKFYLSFGYLDQQGIVTSEISNYLRKNIRLNSDHQVTKWLKIGQTLGFSTEKTKGLGNTNGDNGGPLISAINLDPITPSIITDLSSVPNPAEYAQKYAIKDPNGNYYGISNSVQQEMTNPLAYVQTRLGNYDYADNFIGNVYLEISPISGLKFKSSLNGKLAYYGNESFTPMYYLNPTNNNMRNSLSKTSNRNFGWSIENTLQYAKRIGSHNVSLLLGQGTYVDDIGSGQSTTYYNQPVNNHNEASFGWSTSAENITGSAYKNNEHIVTSLFTRALYDYKEKYIFTGIIRRDGSSRFGDNNRFAVFPSFSLGWVPSKEDFWKENNIVNTIKIRGGYGITGNDNIGNFGYLSLVSGGSNYTTGTPGAVVIGSAPIRPSNPDLKWEQTSQTNIGFDAKLFNNFTLTVEWYNKETTGILQGIMLPGYVGAQEGPLGNVASMKNTGFEFELGYRKKIGQLDFSLNGNLSTLKNTVTSVGPDREFNTGPSIQSSPFPLTRSQVGSTYNGFYGFVTDGIFQNTGEILNHTSSQGTVIQPNAVPGDFRYKDVNNDGQITEADRKFIGKPLPYLTYGITLDLKYKGFDLNIMGQGVSGNQIYQGLRRLDVINANWQSNALNRWTGEGTSNTFPRLSTIDNNGNFSKPSDFYLQDGDYFRIKIIQLGYSLPEKLIGQIGLNQLRLYVTGENLITFTKYTGYDPEIGGDVMGIDRGYYPQARSMMLGCNLKF